MTNRLPGQRPDEDEATYLARIEKRVQEKLEKEYSSVPQRFCEIKSSSLSRSEHPIFRTTQNDYGKMDMTDYERPNVYKTVSRRFTEKEHLGQNYEHCGLNI